MSGFGIGPSWSVSQVLIHAIMTSSEMKRPWSAWASAAPIAALLACRASIIVRMPERPIAQVGDRRGRPRARTPASASRQDGSCRVSRSSALWTLANVAYCKNTAPPSWLQALSGQAARSGLIRSPCFRLRRAGAARSISSSGWRRIAAPCSRAAKPSPSLHHGIPRTSPSPRRREMQPFPIPGRARNPTIAPRATLAFRTPISRPGNVLKQFHYLLAPPMRRHQPASVSVTPGLRVIRSRAFGTSYATWRL